MMMTQSNWRPHHYSRTADEQRTRQRCHAKRASEQPSRARYSSDRDVRFRIVRTVSTSDDVANNTVRPFVCRTKNQRPTTEQLFAATIHCASDKSHGKATCDRYVQPTLRQAWPREYPRPQYAFKISMFNVSCNSHYFTQLAALFIDTRAE